MNIHKAVSIIIICLTIGINTTYSFFDNAFDAVPTTDTDGETQIPSDSSFYSSDYSEQNTYCKTYGEEVSDPRCGNENTAGRCYYRNEAELAADMNDNCEIDTNLERCRLELNQRVSACQDDPENKTCVREELQCGFQNGTWVLQPIGTPFDIEFYDVTDPETGLRASDQGNRFATEGSEIGTTEGVIREAVSLLARIVSIFALIVFIIGTFFLITANGEENQIEKGKNAITYSLIGIIVVLLSYTIVRLVQGLFI